METSKVDIQANRRAQKWGLRAQAGRIVWALVWPLFVLSPRPIWWWRRLLLRMMGAQIGRSVHIYPTVKITIPWNLSIGDEAAVGDCVNLYALGLVQIGARVTISQGAHLCAGTHDYNVRSMPLIKTPIVVGEEAWICADAFIGPGVKIGSRAIVGARAVVVGDVEPSAVMVGNPARKAHTRSS